MQVYTSHAQYNTSWCFKCKTIHVLTSKIETRYRHASVHTTSIYFLINIHQGIFCDILTCMLTKRSQPLFTSNQALSALQFPIHAWAFHLVQLSSSHWLSTSSLWYAQKVCTPLYTMPVWYILVYTSTNQYENTRTFIYQYIPQCAKSSSLVQVVGFPEYIPLIPC